MNNWNVGLDGCNGQAVKHSKGGKKDSLGEGFWVIFWPSKSNKAIE